MSSPIKQNNSVWNTLEGQVIEGKYFLNQLLSSGSYGGVFAADEVVADKMMRRLAVKLITPSPEYPDRQTEELLLATTMDHPNILRCFSPGVCTLNGVRLLYIVMELASSSLADRLVDSLLEPDEAVTLAQGMLSALIYLGGGDRPLVHRDIKPANILNVNGTWKLADFGLLRGIGPERVAQTRTLLGTAEYAPPEAFDGTVSTAWDMWSLGVVLVEALTGALPFDESTQQELQNAIIHAPARNVDGLGEPLEPIVRGCLTKERMRRWTAEEALGVLRGTAPAPIIPAATGRQNDNLFVRKARYPFRFKLDTADTIPELIALCEEFPYEAQDYLTNRYFVKWFGDAMEDPALAREASGCSQLHGHEPERAVELFVRELRRAAGMPFDPQMVTLQQRLDFGLMSVGEMATKSLPYQCDPRRHVWGITELVGNLPGVSVDQSFGTASAPVVVRVNLLDVQAGYYSGSLVLHPQGLANSINVPISYTVRPLRVRVTPSSLSFGSVNFGVVCTRHIEILTDSPAVVVRGSASIVPPCPGITIVSELEGSLLRLNVTADCGQLAAGRDYVRRVMLETSGGNYQIPLRLRVLAPIKPIVLSVVVGAVAAGAVAALVRNVVDLFGGVPGHWFLQYPSSNQYDTLFRLIGSPAIAFVAGYLFRRFARWRWPLLYEQHPRQPTMLGEISRAFRNGMQ